MIPSAEKSQAHNLGREDVRGSLAGVQGANAVDVEVARSVCAVVIAKSATQRQEPSLRHLFL